jgi:hypothetical protein
MRPADLPAIHKLLKIQNDRDGTKYGIPQVFDAQGKRLSRIPLALVAVDTETGEVRQAHIYEHTVEQLTIGTDREATVCSMHEQDSVFWLLRQRGFEDLHIFVPNQRVKQMQHGLESILGMTCMKEFTTGFYRCLDPETNDAVRAFYAAQIAQEEAV